MRSNAHLARAARIAAFVLLGIAATAGVTLAAGQGVPSTPPTPTVSAPSGPLVVPDVRRLAFVFAKGQLEESGFGWRVRGKVHGYPANTVVTQDPAPGTRVQDVGAPLVTLTLERTKGYPETGEPEDRSPFGGGKPKLAGGATR
ncbi:MAG TPA: PASTA domain-containing protein [Gaiellaceae bacterium]|nr:PASTA domain-containing protein [Gaiellaceae bacterium]